jgi:Xaa-Pro aminopeptidase
MTLSATSRFRQRRTRLAKSVGTPTLLMGVGHRPRNLPMSPVPFRQDSTFLYFSGVSEPNAAMLIETDGSTTLFLPSPSVDDSLWHGPSPSLAEKTLLYDVDQTVGSGTLSRRSLPDKTQSLATPDSEKNRQLTGLLGREFEFGRHIGDPALVAAVINMRCVKEGWEINQMKQAASASTLAHLAVMQATGPDVPERLLAAVFQGVLAGQNCTLAYPTILTVHGEVLHQFHQRNTLKNGQLLLIDGGGEVDSGYGVDITRTYPVSGRFSGRQRAVYEVVLAAQLQAIAKCHPGVEFRDVHNTAGRVIAQFLKDEGIVSCSADEAVELGLHALVFPHGVGHHLGLDVHDMENFGDLPSYPVGVERSRNLGTRYLRLNLPLESGWVVTVEPGFYMVDAILDQANLRDKFSHVVDFETLDQWRGFGGIRIEDDILITETGPCVLTAAVPKTISALEAIVGQGPTARQRLG